MPESADITDLNRAKSEAQPVNFNNQYNTMEEEVKEYRPLNFQRIATEAPNEEQAYEDTPTDQFSEFYTNVQRDKCDQNS